MGFHEIHDFFTYFEMAIVMSLKINLGDAFEKVICIELITQRSKKAIPVRFHVFHSKTHFEKLIFDFWSFRLFKSICVRFPIGILNTSAFSFSQITHVLQIYRSLWLFHSFCFVDYLYFCLFSPWLRCFVRLTENYVQNERL